MMAQTSRNIVVLALVLLLAGCGSVWSRVEPEKRVTENAAFSVELPVGWMRYQPANGQFQVRRPEKTETLKVDRVRVTRDGVSLEFIDVIRFDPQNAFPYVKKGYKEGMLPSEAAELYIANLKNAPGLENLTVFRNSPKTLAGRAGFELHVQFKNEKGLPFERLVCAFGDKSGFYVLTYQAPSLHYFGMYREVFNRVSASLKLRATRT